MKEFSELDIFYEFLEVLMPLESDAEKGLLGKKASKKNLRRQATELKFLSDLLRQRMSIDLQNKEDVPSCLERRIDKEQQRMDNADKRYQARIANLKKANQNPSERVERLRKAMTQQKELNEQRKRKAEEESKLQADGEHKEAQD
jgi:hypothetical protein